jgi:hypothetical protein
MLSMIVVGDMPYSLTSFVQDMNGHVKRSHQATGACILHASAPANWLQTDIIPRSNFLSSTALPILFLCCPALRPSRSIRPYRLLRVSPVGSRTFKSSYAEWSASTSEKASPMGYVISATHMRKDGTAALMMTATIKRRQRGLRVR